MMCVLGPAARDRVPANTSSPPQTATEPGHEAKGLRLLRCFRVKINRKVHVNSS